MTAARPVFEGSQTPHPDAPLRTFLSAMPLWELRGPELFSPTHEIVYVDSLGRVRRCPRRFVIDGASVPRVPWLPYRQWDPTTAESAALHDVPFCVHDLTLRDANALLHECLVVKGFRSPDLFRRAVSSPWGWWSYYKTPDQPANREIIAQLQEEYQLRGFEMWRPETKVEVPI
ncbi:MAG: DUF1353 domain-containing protein [Verrucomicrobia bacterium]|nr:DUF1353 domain-containing protein [Verrucomicrobiota bacterium]